MQSIIEFLRAYPDVAQFVGVVGFMIYISSFFSVQCGHLCGNGILFPVLQVTAATCVLVSLASAYNLASFMIQTSYIAIGLYGIAIRLRRVRAGRKRAGTPIQKPQGLTEPEPDCHQPATLFRHRPEQGESPKSHALYS